MTEVVYIDLREFGDKSLRTLLRRHTTEAENKLKFYLELSFKYKMKLKAQKLRNTEKTGLNLHKIRFVTANVGICENVFFPNLGHVGICP